MQVIQQDLLRQVPISLDLFLKLCDLRAATPGSHWGSIEHLECNAAAIAPDLWRWIRSNGDDAIFGMMTDQWVLDPLMQESGCIVLINHRWESITNVANTAVLVSPQQSWGYMGSGPHQLAISILSSLISGGSIVGSEYLQAGSIPLKAFELANLFTREVVSTIPQFQSTIIPLKFIEDWIEAHK